MMVLAGGLYMISKVSEFGCEGFWKKLLHDFKVSEVDCDGFMKCTLLTKSDNNNP